MNRVVFIDANVPIYAAGRDHPYKEPCVQILRMVAEEPLSFVTNAEVLQELMHRYLASGRWSLGREVVKGFAEVMQGRVEAVLVEDILLAATLADVHPRVSSRDLVHGAVMQRLGIGQVISADADFDVLEGIERLDPIHIEDWGSTLMVGNGD